MAVLLQKMMVHDGIVTSLVFCSHANVSKNLVFSKAQLLILAE
jgi:hypothetical protein